MSGFIYNGKSTESILSSPLILASFDSIDSIKGSERNGENGETTILRPISNEYGTTYSNTPFEYSLVKQNGEIINKEEQVVIERWLTSSKFSQNLQIIDLNGNIVCTYCGKFMSTNWKPCGNGWAGVVFSFESKFPYPFKEFEYTYEIRGEETIDLNCDSDELEEYIYPIITITEPNETAQVSIMNITDESNKMEITAYHELPMTFDCLHCIPSDGTTNGIISYADLGWTDVGNIYWLRLLPGINKIKINGNADVTISFKCPFKRVGGWYL